VLTGLLRGELGYDGLIVTDGIEMQAIAGTYGIEHGTVLALAAGADAICVGGGLSDDETVRRLRDALVAAVRSGELPEERLADAAQRVRALATWTATTEVAQPDPTLTDIGLVAARRALRVTRVDPWTPPAEPLFVASFSPETNIAVGTETPWGVSAELTRLVPGTETGSFAGEDAGHAAIVAAGERRVVAVVRDEHRHPWMAGALDTLLKARPDTIVVEMGVPQSAPRGPLYIATHGAARVCGVAAAEVIAGVTA
jgi:beta-N-acetylhexosaminidase